MQTHGRWTHVGTHVVGSRANPHAGSHGGSAWVADPRGFLRIRSTPLIGKHLVFASGRRAAAYRSVVVSPSHASCSGGLLQGQRPEAKSVSGPGVVAHPSSTIESGQLGSWAGGGQSAQRLWLVAEGAYWDLTEP